MKPRSIEIQSKGNGNSTKQKPHVIEGNAA
jgi:hypothetical protein